MSMTNVDTRHIPVLLDEVLEYLAPENDCGDCLLLDCTLGGGGHSEALLEQCASMYLVGMDRDLAAIRRVQERLSPFSNRICLIHGNFADIEEHLEQLPPDATEIFEARGRRFHRILVDMGLSSDQLDDGSRGFSFRSEAPLDMRMDPSASLTAAEVINTYDPKELKRVLQRGGVGARSASLAKAIVADRPLTTTKELADICTSVLRTHGPSPRQHLATVPFQAIRIEVNDEIGAIESFLDTVVQFLAPKGRLAVISFHSLEDQLVTKRMRRWSRAEATLAKVPLVGDSAVVGKLLTSTAVTASEVELSSNSRSRSARLRVFEKTNNQSLQ